MAAYGEPSSEHKSAVREIAEKRQQAHAAASEIAKAGTPHHHTHLAPANEGGDNLSVVCTQSVVDYLLQLRPYRASSENWGVDFGIVTLPEELGTGGVGGYGIKQSKLTIEQSPRIGLRNTNEVIAAANKSIRYSSSSGVGGYGLKSNGTTNTYKFVFSPDQLLRLVALADEIATDLNLLVDIEEPDYDSGGQGAV